MVIELCDLHEVGVSTFGESVAFAAERDINVVGGTVSAAMSLMAKAGNDINVITTTSTNRGGDEANGYANTTVDRIAGLILEPGDAVDVPPEQRGMVLDAGRNANLQAALIANAVRRNHTHQGGQGCCAVYRQYLRRATHHLGPKKSSVLWSQRGNGHRDPHAESYANGSGWKL